jgi:hypothetical protein
MIKGNGFAQGINYNTAILAFGDMAFDLFTQFFFQRSIHKIGQGAQQGSAFGMFMVAHSLLLFSSRSP